MPVAESTGTLPTVDGARLPWREWAPAGGEERRGHLLVVHGLGEHAGRYDGLAAELVPRGISVRAYDQRGHGHHEGRRAVVPDPETPVDDVRAAFDQLQADAGQPPLLLGHSMGGAFAARAVTSGRVNPRALLLSSPALALHDSPLRRTAAALARRYIPDVPLTLGFALGRVSHDPEARRDFRADPLTHGYLSSRLYDAMRQAGILACREAPALQVPTLMLVSGSDTIVDVRGARAFAAAAPPDRLRLRWYDELYHELFNEMEPYRSQVMADLHAFLSEVLG